MLLNTPALAIGSVLIASVLGGVAPFLFEHGSKQLQGRVTDFVLNPYIIAGMATYLAVMVFFTYAFKLGGSVKVLYPIYATTFIWAAVIIYSIDSLRGARATAVASAGAQSVAALRS